MWFLLVRLISTPEASERSLRKSSDSKILKNVNFFEFSKSRINRVKPKRVSTLISLRSESSTSEHFTLGPSCFRVFGVMMSPV